MPENFPFGKFSNEKITALTYVGAVFLLLPFSLFIHIIMV